MQDTDSNTTLVKVKWYNKNISIFVFRNSNTTLVKVKYIKKIGIMLNTYNSNTTLVKVKLGTLNN